jgi:uncharacterized protein YrrD
LRVGSARHITTPDLCYLKAQNVEIPAGKLADLEVCSRDDEKLGDLDGVLIEPSARRVRYLVVKPSGWFRGRYLLPVQDVTRVERDQNVLRIEAPAAEVSRETFTPDAVRPFTDEDVITVMFAPDAAA